MYGNNGTWTERTIARLRELWSKGMSTSEIGRHLGISKNAVVGKAHRLDLPGRHKPIKRDGRSLPKPETPRIRRAGSQSTLPTLKCLQQPFSATASGARDGLTIRRLPATEKLSAVPSPQLRPGQKSQPCCWPIGDPGSTGFRICDASSLPGKPYCEKHHRRAHTGARDHAD